MTTDTRFSAAKALALQALLALALFSGACLDGDNGLAGEPDPADSGDGWSHPEQALEAKVLGDLLLQQPVEDLAQGGVTLRDAIHPTAETGLFQCPEAGTVEVTTVEGERQLRAENCLATARVMDGAVGLEFGDNLRDFEYWPLDEPLRVERLDRIRGVVVSEGRIERLGDALEAWVAMDDLAGQLLLGGGTHEFRIDSLQTTAPGRLQGEWTLDFAIPGLADRCDVGEVRYQRRFEEDADGSARVGELERRAAEAEADPAEYRWEDADTLRITVDGRSREFSASDYQATLARCLP